MSTALFELPAITGPIKLGGPAYSLCALGRDRCAAFDAFTNAVFLFDLAAGTRTQIELPVTNETDVVPQDEAGRSYSRSRWSIAGDSSGRLAILDGTRQRISLWDTRRWTQPAPLNSQYPVDSIEMSAEGNILLFGRFDDHLLVDFGAGGGAHPTPLVDAAGTTPRDIAIRGDRPFVTLRDGGMAFVRHQGLEVLDLLAKDYSPLARFIGLQQRVASRMVDQWVNDASAEKPSLCVRIPPRNDSIVSLTRYENGLAALVCRNFEWYIEFFSGNLDWTGVKRLPSARLYCSFLHAGGGVWVMGDRSRHLHVLSEKDFLAVEKEQYLSELGAVDKQFLEADEDDVRVPRVIDSSLAKFWDIRSGIEQFSSAWADIRIDAHGHTSRIEQIGLSGPGLVARRPSSSAEASMRDILRALEFTPMLRQGKPHDCSLTIYMDLVWHGGCEVPRDVAVKSRR